MILNDIKKFEPVNTSCDHDQEQYLCFKLKKSSSKNVTFSSMNVTVVCVFDQQTDDDERWYNFERIHQNFWVRGTRQRLVTSYSRIKTPQNHISFPSSINHYKPAFHLNLTCLTRVRMKPIFLAWEITVSDLGLLLKIKFWRKFWSISYKARSQTEQTCEVSLRRHSYPVLANASHASQRCLNS